MGNNQLIEDLIEHVSKIQIRDSNSLDGILRRSEMMLRNIFGADCHYLVDLKKLRFSPNVFPADENTLNRSWNNGINTLVNLLNAALEELVLFNKGTTPSPMQSSAKRDNKIFIVHGHDDALKLTVARTIEKLGFEPIILHEKPNMGRTIIEKFTDYANVGFAIILLSPDDIAYSKDEKHENAYFRARQNVVFEMGYFIGVLGRKSVFVLYKKEPKFEIPSDYSGVLYTSFDSTDNWKIDLVKELKASGYIVDANKII
jgi:predicted nucleotide-binding protein